MGEGEGGRVYRLTIIGYIDGSLASSQADSIPVHGWHSRQSYKGVGYRVGRVRMKGGG